MAADPPRWRLRPGAADDLDAIYDRTVVEWSVDQAEQYISGMAAVFDLLAKFPKLGRLRQELNPPLRLHPYRSHVIAYDVSPGGLEIVRVLHARQDWRALLA